MRTFEELDEIGIQVSKDQAEVNEAREDGKVSVEVGSAEGAAKVKFSGEWEEGKEIVDRFLTGIAS